MKNIFKKINIVVALSVASMLALSSCDDDEPVSFSTGDPTTLENSESFIQVVTPVVSFQAGTESYDIQVNAIQGYNRIASIKVINVYSDAETATGLTSEAVELGSFNLTAGTGERAVLEISLTYDDLRAGITIGGNPLSTSDFDLAVGASWSLSFEAVYDDGTSETLPGSIAVAVLSPYAGLYQVTEAEYFRISVDRADVVNDQWLGEDRFIGSVNETTFSYNDFFGAFAFAGEFFTFSVDFDTNKVTVPTGGLNPSAYTINCIDNENLFQNVDCDNSNVLIPDNVNGHHVFKLTYGYYTASGDENEGAREFYEVLEKY